MTLIQLVFTVEPHLIIAVLDQVVGSGPHAVLYILVLDLVPLDAGAAVGARPVPHDGGGGAVPLGDARGARCVRYRERELFNKQGS